MLYDCIVIGGGIAGLQAAIQLGRSKRKVLVVDTNYGRSTLCKRYHNLLGYPDGISGEELRKIGKKQAESFGAEYVIDTVEKAHKNENHFLLTLKSGEVLTAKRILIATGVMDRIPDIPKLLPCLGISVFICPDCDGYEVKNKPTMVLGSGNPGANMALTLSFWTNELIYINHEQAKVDNDILTKLHQKGIEYREEIIQDVLTEGPYLQGLILNSGNKLEVQHCFLAFGGNEVKSQLAKQLGVRLMENNHIQVDPRTKMTNVQHVWAAGDVTAHSEQVAIAMGDGLQAAIWIHKSLLNEE